MENNKLNKEEKPSFIQVLLDMRRKKKDFKPGPIEGRKMRLEDTLRKIEE